MENENKIPVSVYYKQYRPCRLQLEFMTMCLDDLLPHDHKARAIWDFVSKMDTDPCFRKIKTLLGGPGRPTTSPKVLLALWLYSIIDGNISARKIEDLCKYHDAYKWIAGGVPINRTMLADFRSVDPLMFDQLLTNCLAVMMKEGVIDDEIISQDGTRVKGSAGNNSYRREQTLIELQKEASLHLKKLNKEKTSDPTAFDRRKKAAHDRAANERLERTEKAIESLRQFQEAKTENDKKNRTKASAKKDLKEVRASVTDPDIKRMKMGDGGYRLAYNIQFATGTSSRVIFGVDAVNTLDPGTLLPMMMQVHKRFDEIKLSPPSYWIADAAYSSKEDVQAADTAFPHCTFYAPPKVIKGIDPTIIRKGDSDPVKRWRGRIDSEEIKEIYKARPSSAEFSNAQVKNKGFKEILVRGLKKVKGVACLHAIAQNIERYLDLKTKKALCEA